MPPHLVQRPQQPGVDLPVEHLLGELVRLAEDPGAGRAGVLVALQARSELA